MLQAGQKPPRSALLPQPQVVPTAWRAGRTAAAVRSRRCATAATTNRGGQQLAANMVGAAAALGLLLTPAGASSAAALLEPPTAAQPPQELVLTAASLQPPDAWPAACVLGGASSSTEQQAPDLVTDADLEAAAAAASSSSPFCLPDKAALEATLASGLGWVEEAGNFSESNFAALGAPSTSMWLSNSPWCLVWDAYCNVLTRRPVATKLATGMLGTFLGDMLAQATQGLVSTQRSSNSSRTAKSSSSSSSGGFELDLARTARLVGFSALVGTPVAFVWFSLLDQYVCPGDPTSPLAVFSKVALDQVLMAPAMTSAFFAAMTLLEGRARSPSEVAAAVRSKLRPTLLANWTVWPLAHVINFSCIAPAQRILYINVVNIAWTAFMSHMASSSEGDSSKAPQQEQQKQSASAAAAAAHSSRQLQRAGR